VLCEDFFLNLLDCGFVTKILGDTDFALHEHHIEPHNQKINRTQPTPIPATSGTFLEQLIDIPQHGSNVLFRKTCLGYNLLGNFHILQVVQTVVSATHHRVHVDLHHIFITHATGSNLKWRDLVSSDEKHKGLLCQRDVIVVVATVVGTATAAAAASTVASTTAAAAATATSIVTISSGGGFCFFSTLLESETGR